MCQNYVFKFESLSDVKNIVIRNIIVKRSLDEVGWSLLDHNLRGLLTYDTRNMSV